MTKASFMGLTPHSLVNRLPRCLTEKSTRNEVDASAEYPLKAGGGKGGGGTGAGVICPVDMWMNGDREMSVNRHKNLGRGTG